MTNTPSAAEREPSRGALPGPIALSRDNPGIMVSVRLTDDQLEALALLAGIDNADPDVDIGVPRPVTIGDELRGAVHHYVDKQRQGKPSSDIA